MSALTPTTIIRENVGSLTLLIFPFTTVTDGDTYASGLGGNVVSYNVFTTANPTTQTSAGVAATNSNGTFTFYPGEDGNPQALQVLARV